MGCQSCFVFLRVVTLDQGDLLGGLVAQIVPLMVRVVLHTEDTTDLVRIYQLGGNEIVFLVKVVPVGDSEGIMINWVRDRSPYVDDADTTLQKARCLFTKMCVNSRHTGVVGLINMNSILIVRLISRLDFKHRGRRYLQLDL